MKLLLLAAASALTLAAAGPAGAATYNFAFTSTQYNATFTLPSSPASTNYATGQYFFLNGVAGTLNGAATVFDGLIFTNTGYTGDGGNGIRGGGFSYNNDFNNFFYGPQLYTGTEAAPTFRTGTFNLSSYRTNLPGVLVITDAAAVGVPEPATWGLMLMGFCMVGAGLRARRRSVTFA